jgi:hypothetical protein
MIPDNDKAKSLKKEHEDVAMPPDPETIGKTDPQENMKGPISSLVHKVEERMDENYKEDIEKQKED